MTRDSGTGYWEYNHHIRPGILERDDYTCQKCGGHGEGQGLCVHHIIPRSEGGTDTPDNLVTLCEYCHALIHQPDSWNCLMRSSALRSIERKRAKLTELTSRFMAALYGQEILPCDLWEGDLIVFLER